MFYLTALVYASAVSYPADRIPPLDQYIIMSEVWASISLKCMGCSYHQA